MKLQVIGSSSNGNGYALTADNGDILLIEAGYPFRQVVREIGYTADRIVGCLVTHEHLDHARHAEDYASQGYFPVLMTYETATALYLFPHANVKPAPTEPTQLGSFTVRAISCHCIVNDEWVMLHDSAHPACYIVSHAEMGNLLFATDLYCLPTTNISGLNHIMVECNYYGAALDANYHNGRIGRARYERIILSHMSLETLCEQLRQMDTTRVREITLLHLSNENGNGPLFAHRVEAATGCCTNVARRGLTLTLDNYG